MPQPPFSVSFFSCSGARCAAAFWLVAILFSPMVQGAEWSCSNPDIEVRCTEGRCSGSSGDQFTPLSVSFDEQGHLSVCAYSGCWEGAGAVQYVDHWLMINAEQLPFYPLGDSYGDISLLFDPEERLAFVRTDLFAQPLYCQ